MLKFFKTSIIVTILGLLAGYFWGEYRLPGSGFLAVFIVAILGILEVSLSFDNAVINATKLEKMTKVWQHRFLTWGILIAVFGMRLLFPISIVSAFSGIDIIETTKMTLFDVEEYTHYLELTHIPVLVFGASFLIMLFFHFFFDENKEIHWIKPLEDKLAHLGNIDGIETAMTLISLMTLQHFLPQPLRMPVILSGLSGIVLYILVHGISAFMEQHAPKNSVNGINQSFKAGFIMFMYLELIDASFSLDGVLGAFALSKDIVIITLGLAIGAMFVRSFTVMLVEKKTLHKYIFLEHGAHWAIGALALIMFLSAFWEIPEVVTGLIGFIFIAAAFISSLIYNKQNGEVIEKLDS